MLTLATDIREARAAANLSQAELAKQIGCSLRSLQAWEAGTIPQPRYRRALKVFLNGEQQAA